MKYRAMILPCLLTFVFAAAAFAQAPDIDALLAKVATYDHGQSREGPVDLDTAVAAALASPEKTKEMEAKLLKAVQGQATAAGKDIFCRQLSLVGGPASVPVLAKMLVVPETSNIARYALERIPAPAAVDALRAAAETTGGKVQIGIINTLGRRKDARSLPLFVKLTKAGDEAVAIAAAEALGDIGGVQALKALAGARGTFTGKAKEHATEAYLRAVDALAATDKKTALAGYKTLYAKTEPEMTRVAALRGIKNTSGAAAIPTLSDAMFAGGKLEPVAVRLLAEIPGAPALKALTDAYPKLAPGAQARLLTAASTRADAAGIQQVLQAALKSPEKPVRMAAYSGLGKTGEAQGVMLLAAAAASASDDIEQNAARENLYQMRGAGVDAAVVSGIKSSADVKVQTELIRATSERGIAAAADTLLETAKSGERDVRRESIRALKDTAAPSHVPALLGLLGEAKQAADRTEIERTLAYVLKRTDPAPVAPVVDAYRSATAAPHRSSLLQVMGQVGSKELLPVIREALKDSDPQIGRAAILALSEWQSIEPLEDLIGIARAGSNPAQQVLALRGYIRLATLPAQRPPRETARMLSEAMALAKQPDEKRAILAALVRYPSPESLALAEASLKDEAVASEAKMTVERLKRALTPKK